MGWDIIGDVHGHAKRLEALLDRLGYQHARGAWRNPERTAVFVGDFIDRGPGQLATLELVRDMVDAGAAHAVMGNHELNAIGWLTRDPVNPSVFLRPRHDAAGVKNARQHEAFLAEVGSDSDTHHAWVAWFAALPLWFEHETFRVVHACWDPAAVELVRPYLDADARFNPGAAEKALRRGTALNEAVDVLLKGPEVTLPGGCTFTDKDGHVRGAIRVRWWDESATTYADAYMGPPGANIPALPLPAAQRLPEPDRPTFVGHYWLDAADGPAPLSPSVACVDYSVAKGGPLAAYRFDGEPSLEVGRFVVV